jgi:hypothetical protein
LGRRIPRAEIYYRRFDDRTGYAAGLNWNYRPVVGQKRGTLNFNPHTLASAYCRAGIFPARTSSKILATPSSLRLSASSAVNRAGYRCACPATGVTAKLLMYTSSRV